MDESKVVEIATAAAVNLLAREGFNVDPSGLESLPLVEEDPGSNSTTIVFGYGSSTVTVVLRKDVKDSAIEHGDVTVDISISCPAMSTVFMIDTDRNPEYNFVYDCHGNVTFMD